MRAKLQSKSFDGKILHERGIVENWPDNVPLPKTAVNLSEPAVVEEPELDLEPKKSGPKTLPKSGV